MSISRVLKKIHKQSHLDFKIKELEDKLSLSRPSRARTMKRTRAAHQQRRKLEALLMELRFNYFEILDALNSGKPATEANLITRRLH